MRRHKVCICGSLRFTQHMLDAYRVESLAGSAVSLPVLGLNPKAAREAKELLDELHRDKILDADEVLVVTVNGYVGESTRSEIQVAEQHGKPVRYREYTEEVAA